jgi:hypothetical protein
LEKLEFKWEKILGFRDMQEKLEKSRCFKNRREKNIMKSKIIRRIAKNTDT